MYAILAFGSCCAGYFFYQWRASISHEKEHPTRRSKKLSLLKLWWGFLFLTTLPGFLCFWLALMWMWEMMLLNALTALLLGFAFGGIVRFPIEMHAFRLRWPKDEDDGPRDADIAA